MISLLIPSTGKNEVYANNIRDNISELYSDRVDEFEILISVNDKLTLSQHYNELVKNANGDIIVLLHDDMVLHKNFLDTIKQNIKPKRILTYTRVEPPIYNDEYPGKIIKNFGYELVDFKNEEFQKMNLPDDLIDGGSQLFFACYKNDYIGLDGITYNLFCEDDDIHLRYKILGYEKKVCSAMVYHFVSKTSRTGEYQTIEMNSNRNFIRKWSFRRSTHNKKMNNVFRIKNCNLKLLSYLEPFSYRIYTDLPNDEVDRYIRYEQVTTSFNLKTKIFNYQDNIDTGLVNSVIDLDANSLSEEIFNIPQLLSDILVETSDTGQYEIDCFKVNVLSTKPQEIICIL